MSNQHVCYDIKYDGGEVRVLDKDNKELLKKNITVFSLSKDNIDTAMGKNPYEIQKNKFLIHDPKQKFQCLSAETSYAWYVKKSAVKEYNFVMNSNWEPIFCEKTLSSKSINNTVNIIVVPDLEVMTRIKEEKDNLIIFPLLESITHIHQIFYGFNLQQIRIFINDAYEKKINNVEDTMRFLFDYFLDDFNKISCAETCCFSDIHKCLFNIILKHPYNEIQAKIDIQNKLYKSMQNVCMIVKSEMLSSTSYGDIMWYISTNQEKERSSSSIVYSNGPFVYIQKEKFQYESKKHVFYYNIVVFPEIKYNEITYPHGSSIGLRDKNSSIIEFRGPLFHNITLKERLILHMTFYEFSNDTLVDGMDFIKGTRNIPFDETDCDVKFLNELKSILIKAKH